MAEKATVQLIQLFPDLTDINPVDENGEQIFSVSTEEINDENWRTELKKPVDKYDWLVFEKIFQSVFIYPESERKKLCEYWNQN